jgi:hypothetical protein
MPPTASPTSPSPATTSPRHSGRPSKSLSAAADKDSGSSKDGHRATTQHRRDKASASSIHRPRQDSLPSENRPVPLLHEPIAPSQRPLLKSRTKSAPIIPNGMLQDPPSRANGLHGRDVAPSDSGDDEISQDPFFQRYTEPQNDSPDIALVMKSPRLDRSETLPSSTSQNHFRQDLNQDQAHWPASQPRLPVR